MTINEARKAARDETPVDYFGKRYTRIISITEHYNSRDDINTHTCILHRERCKKSGVEINSPYTSEVWYEASAVDKNGNIVDRLKIQGLRAADSEELL